MTRHSTVAARLVGVALLAIASLAHARDYELGDIGIAHPYSVPTPPGATIGAGYVGELSNHGAADDRLVAIRSPAVDRVEVHTMAMDGNVMRMRQVPELVIPAKGRVAMAPGNGYHLMLVGIRQPLKAGDRIPLTLTFARAGTVEVELLVQERGAAGAMHLH